MGLMKLLGDGPVALDTAPFIYFIEDHPKFAPLVEELFERIVAGTQIAVTSAVTLLEVLVIPYRHGRVDIAEQYERLLGGSPHLLLVPIQDSILREAARIRAELNVKTPDALQLATARLSGCTTFLTNDRRLPPVPGLQILTLTDVAERGRPAS